MRLLYDTNILIDFLVGDQRAQAELTENANRAISVITWMEVMVGSTVHDEMATRSFLRAFTVIGIDTAVQERAVSVRRSRRIRLPDAIIWATAQVHGRVLVTRNIKDFPAREPGIRVPYTV